MKNLNFARPSSPKSRSFLFEYLLNKNLRSLHEQATNMDLDSYAKYQV